MNERFDEPAASDIGASAPLCPRIKKPDVLYLAERLRIFSESKAKHEEYIRERPNQRPQINNHGLSLASKYLAFYEFGLGFPAEKVRQTFAEVAAASLKVFELLGTEDSARDNPEGPAKEYSTTNSQYYFEAINMALIAGECSIAEKLADLMWDPPKADYIGPRSEVCTPDQQNLAYAVKYLFQNNLEDLDKQLRRIEGRRGEGQVAAMAKMVRGLAEKSDAKFGEGLLELLFWHRRAAKRPQYKDVPWMFFSLAAVALSILAVRRGLLKKKELPKDDYLPLELIPDS